MIYTLLVFILFQYNSLFLDCNSFDRTISNSKTVTIIEYWADWNSTNEFNEYGRLKRCNYYRVNIENCMEIQKQNKITVVPTIVVYFNGQEYIRHEADLLLQLDVGYKDIQKDIEKIYYSKFK